jgi:hypothetical protein
MRENARASCLITPESVVARQRHDLIALTNGGQVGRGLVEASVLPRILAALHSEGFDQRGQRGLLWFQEAHVRGHVRTETVWQEVALIGWAHKAIEIATKDFSEDGLLHQVIPTNLGESVLQMR